MTGPRFTTRVYQIASQDNSTFVTLPSPNVGTAITLAEQSSQASNQQWRVTALVDGSYTIASVATSTRFSAPLASNAQIPNPDVIASAIGQTWFIQQVGVGNAYEISESQSKLKWGSTTKNGPIQIGDNLSNTVFQFSPDPATLS